MQNRFLQSDFCFLADSSPPDVRLVHNMIVGSGIDLVEIARIEQSLERFGPRFLNRVFTPAEQAYCLRKRNAAESLAARFAAKEAGAKALGTGISRGVNWLEIEVVREPGGRPNLRFHGRAAEMAAHLGVAHAALSITHTATLSMANVILENQG
jgi:holo-[acyl-carrier protein] synthase